ncbi:hypothetical protein KFE25_002267 [Diacronema lutheri]|uniref:Uncharacterized protein n=1 Tax=Diacronema lutheri TaxID=2081491 RepID=A0A8J5X739_DIALT|nr:hypothetical protein KFE25_002267 [Diacronema lutheri]
MHNSYEVVESIDGTSWMMPPAEADDDSVADEAIASLALLIQGSGRPRDDADGERATSALSLASSAELIEDATVPPLAPAATVAQTIGAKRAFHRHALRKAALALLGVAMLAAICADADAWRRARSVAAPTARKVGDPAQPRGARSFAPSASAGFDASPPPPPTSSPAEPARPSALAWALMRRHALAPCSVKQLGLSFGLGMLGLAVGVPYVPGLTDNLVVGALAGALPLAADLPCGLPAWQQWAGGGSAAEFERNATSGKDALGELKAWLPAWASWASW